MKANLHTLAAALLVAFTSPLLAQAPPGIGKVDTSFNPSRLLDGGGSATVGYPFAIAVMPPDCKVLVAAGGTFVRKLNFDGSPDTTFNVPAFNNNGARVLVPESDGKFIVAGTFSHVGYGSVPPAEPAAGLRRFNPDGTLDASTQFSAILGGVSAVLVQPDGKILVGGSFSPVGASYRALARYNADGSLDDTVPADIPTGEVKSLARQTVGGVPYVIIAGSFTTVGGLSRDGGVARLRLDTLQADPAFELRSAPGQSPGVAPYVEDSFGYPISVAVQSDGKVVVAGNLAPTSGATRNIYRFAADGLMDPSFSAPAMTSPLPGGTWIESLLLQPDNKAIIGGRFEALNGVSRRYVARLNANGTLDTNFHPGTGASAGSPIVYALGLLPSGNVMAGGAIDSFNGVTGVSPTGLGVVRLFGDALATTCLPPSYPLTVNFSAVGTDAGGTVRVRVGAADIVTCDGSAACAPVFPHGTIVSLTPTANAGSRFSHWTGDAGTDLPGGSRLMNINSAKSVTATFIRQYQLNLAVTSPGHGGSVQVQRVTPSFPIDAVTPLGSSSEGSPFNQSLDADEGAVYYYRLSAVAPPGHDVVWNGEGLSEIPGQPLSRRLDLGEDRIINVTFAPRTHTIVVSVSGNGGVSSSPGDILCPTDCEEQFSGETVVTLTAEPAPDWFVDWGASPGTTPPDNPKLRSVTTSATAVQHVTATFRQVHALTLGFNGHGRGTIMTATVTPPGGAEGDDDFSCSKPPGVPCARGYTSDTVVRLVSIVEPGSTFSGWTINDVGAGSANPLTVTMDAAKSVKAAFTRSYPVTVIPSGPGTVVSCFVGWISGCTESGGTCAADIEGSVSLIATPAADHVVLWSVHGLRVPGVAHVSGGPFDCPTGNRLNLTMDGPKTVLANFVPLRTLNVHVVGPGQVTIAPQTVPATAPVTCGPCSPRGLPETTVVQVTAVYDPALVQFTGWTGVDAEAGEAASLTMNGTETVTANFVALPPTVSAITPAADPVLAGRGDLTLSVPTPGGLGPFTYQWLKRNPGDLGSGSSVGAASSYTLPVEDVEPDDEGTHYRVRVSNAGGTTDSGWWTLTFQRDFGDAPPPYPTLKADNGARHILWTTDHARDLRLGFVTAETEGQPDLGADGDTDDGVVPGPIFRGLTGKITVYPNQAGGYLDAWIDFNDDGDWSDSGEQIATARSVAAGLDEFTFPVPPDAVPGGRVARFRISSSTGGLAPAGAAEDGEVEDHLVPVLASPIAGLPASLTVPKDHPPLSVPFRVAASFSSSAAPVSPTVAVAAGETLLASAPALGSSGSSGDFEDYVLVLSPAADAAGEAELVVTATPDGGGAPMTASLRLRIVDALDADGVADGVENGAPGGGDGNGDGNFDRNQLEVASLPNATPAASYVTLVAEHVFGGVRLVDVQAVTPGSVGTPLPPGVSFPEGLVRFRVEGVSPMLPVAKVTIIYHSGLLPTDYWKYGLTAENPTPHWHRLPAYPVPAPAPGSPTDFGVEFQDNKVILHLVDGGFGDADGLQNGVIQDPGGPVVLATTPPTLSIEMLPGQQARISWPEAGSAGLVLKSADSLTPPVAWQTDPATVTTDAGFKRAIVDLLGGARFYRLAQP